MAQPALAVANHFLRLARKDGEGISPLKMQKLVYIAHGWYLALHGKPLINERVEAWTWGPVVRPVYRAFKRYGRNAIDDFAEVLDLQEDTKGNFHIVNEQPQLAGMDEQELVEDVWDKYKKYSGIQLANWSHEPGSPWYNATNQDAVEENIIIDDSEIKSYFRDFKNMTENGVRPPPADPSPEPDPSTVRAVSGADDGDKPVPRATYARWVFFIMSGWLTIIFVIMMLQGFSAWGFKLGTIPITVLVGSTTISLIAMPRAVIDYIFLGARRREGK